MSRMRAVVIVAFGALSASAACGKSAPGTPAAASQRPTAGRVTPWNACDRRLLTAADVAPVLSDPITGTKAIPGDLQSCKFETGSYSSVTVTVRPGLGRTTLAVWKSGKMPISGTPLAGVGDEATWVNDLSEVVAEKNDLLCDIQVMASPGSLRGGSIVARQRAIGALCNKIFSEAQ